MGVAANIFRTRTVKHPSMYIPGYATVLSGIITAFSQRGSRQGRSQEFIEEGAGYRRLFIKSARAKIFITTPTNCLYVISLVGSYSSTIGRILPKAMVFH